MTNWLPVVNSQRKDERKIKPWTDKAEFSQLPSASVVAKYFWDLDLKVMRRTAKTVSKILIHTFLLFIFNQKFGILFQTKDYILSMNSLKLPMCSILFVEREELQNKNKIWKVIINLRTLFIIFDYEIQNINHLI